MTEDTSTPTPSASYPMVQYDLTEAKVAELREKYEGLTIQGPTDKGGLALVHEGRMECKGIRVAIDKRRKHYNSDALVFQRTVNLKAKEATAPVLLLEESLKAEEDRIKKEIAEIKAEKKREAEERLQARVNLLQRFGKQVSLVNLKAMSDGEFQAAYDEAKAEHEAEEFRLHEEAEAEAIRKESERKEKEAKEEEDREEREAKEALLAQERAELDRKAKEQAEREAEINEKEEALEAERQAIENDKAIETTKKEAAEKAQQEEREKIEREAQEKEEADLLAKEKAAWEEKWKPDKDKILAYIASLQRITLPSVKSLEAKNLLGNIENRLEDLWEQINNAIKKM